MNATNKRRGLGRGLSSLLGDEASAAPEGAPEAAAVSGGAKTVPIEFLHPGRYQPRKHMDEAAIKDLAQSIAAKGILQPLLVRPHPDESNAYEIIAGERRWRAAQLARVHEVPVIIKEFGDQEVLEVALIENLQRQDLSPLDEAKGYQQLMSDFNHTQEDLAKVVGKSRSHVANMMRLLNLPDAVKTMLDGGALSVGHARALLNAKDPAKLAKSVVKRGLNVRQTEKLALKETGKPKSGSAKSATAKDSNTLSLERDLTNLLGLKTEIHFRGEGGSVTIHYNSLDQLDDILMRLSQGDAPPHARGPESQAPDPTDPLQAFENAYTGEDDAADNGDTDGEEKS